MVWYGMSETLKGFVKLVRANHASHYLPKGFRGHGSVSISIGITPIARYSLKNAWTRIKHSIEMKL